MRFSSCISTPAQADNKTPSSGLLYACLSKTMANEVTTAEQIKCYAPRA
jgi:hypothetical protein